ncbi:MAG: phosphoenolpyruvate--protein phosphotransferase [Candidatus Cloacimonetes bacterium]|nr:phosphoenolpyruvate--protein phosphotransferase [Candidatus Cloacimonadota bacterium]MCF7812898.1 phosphoenolpyruvate--protein phosphotransferase [Candidatus Cloacimonadota bacterium]MCF7867110.1 phosphoenolpyruvate--protein phosphotransferase [Candidatus Cloacimonadota bacterium]MCF7882570.1 phosphoenolpyruvate--protein phosphotransferase [Candidatus Cloacimonadota bacterium]
MKTIKGIPVSEGIAIGTAHIIQQEKIKIKRKKIQQEDISDELDKFDSDVKKVVKEIDNLIENYTHNQEHKEILSTQKMILKDPEFIQRVGKQIKDKLYSVEHAVSNYFSEVTSIFNKMDNEFYAQRATDYEDVAYRFLSHSLNQRKNRIVDLNEDSVLLKENITPSFVTKVFERNIKGLATVHGSRNSHSSIIARSMQLPMLAGVHNLLKEIEDGDQIILDGSEGIIIINPEKADLEKYQKLFQQEQEYKKKLDKLIDEKAVTKDGKQIKLMSNIEIPDEVQQVIHFKSEGIGLFRTEFLFIDKNKLPTEDEQYEIYKDIADKIRPENLIIRTIDVGGDKLSSILNLTKEENPNLGCRGIRISFENISVFKQQIRAILRANEHGNIKIMFPMISDVAEIIRAKKILKECRNELCTKNVNCCSDIKFGAMIEVPSAVITSDAIAEQCDFLSIGTNDLIQYTLAVDRDNEAVSQYYKACHPSVLRSIKMTVDNAHKNDVSVAVCGEMASEIRYVKLLLGLGVDELSVSPGRLLRVKNAIMNLDMKCAKELAVKALKEDSSEAISKILDRYED